MGDKYDTYFEEKSPASPVDLGLGSTSHKCTLVDKETGEKHTGWGDSQAEAHENALDNAS